MISPSPNPSVSEAPPGVEEETGGWVYDLPDGYDAIRADADTQFEPVRLKPFEPREPSWIERALQAVFDWLADILSPLGGTLASTWPVLQWILLAGLIGFVVYLALRLAGPLRKRTKAAEADEIAEPEWRPEQAQSLALLEDADRLAAAGQFDEAAHLLLQRSVGQIAAAHPEWVEPSSTARELTALPRLSDPARRAFAVMSAAVESSLFALRALSRDDWERARKAYADFALVRIDSPGEVAAMPTETAR